MSFEWLTEPLLHFIRSTDRVYFVYIYSALVFATIAYFVANRGRISLQSWARFCFPRDIYLHRSAKLDYVYFFINTILFAALIAPACYQFYQTLVDLLSGAMTFLAGPPVPHTPSAATLITFTILSAIAFDFGVFFAHYLHHKIPFLWQFHKVHHTAEVLTPITVYRMHPVDDMITVLMSSSCNALVFAIFNHFYPNQISVILAFGLNLLVFLFYLLGYNLRHSHVWVTYGNRVSHILISPAQHQIHHSCKPEHIDKNFGLIFAFWDWLFGSLYIPAQQESLRLGIDDDQENFQSITGLYLQPFRWGFANKPLLSVALILVLTLMVASSLTRYAGGAKSSPAEVVTLQDLTTNEVKDLVAKGYTTVIVPSGGTEQNGPYGILGKHNYIVQRTSERIAHQLQKTLVAPVIAYVPEGDITPPGDHMVFSGTLSVPHEVYASVLEYTARSLKQHGFKLICLVGDHGWDQDDQRIVADKLTQEWRSEAVTVLAVDQYYFNDQVKWLKARGFSEDQIGYHAGIRDISELLAVHPSGVRNDYFNLHNPNLPGINGHYWLSTPAIGEAMLDIKVNAAVRQINTERSRESTPAGNKFP